MSVVYKQRVDYKCSSKGGVSFAAFQAGINWGATANTLEDETRIQSNPKKLLRKQRTGLKSNERNCFCRPGLPPARIEVGALLSTGCRHQMRRHQSCRQSVAKETAGEVDKLQLVILKKTWHGNMIAAIRCKRTLPHRKRRLPLAGTTTFTFQQGIFREEDRVSPGEAVEPLKH